MRLVLWCACALAYLAGVAESTVSAPTSFRPGVTTDTSSGTINALTHPTPLVVLTSDSSITLNGISSAGVANGETVTVLRTGRAVGSTITVANDAAAAAAGDRIILGNGNTAVSVTCRAGFKFVYYSPYWYMVSYAR